MFGVRNKKPEAQGSTPEEFQGHNHEEHLRVARGEGKRKERKRNGFFKQMQYISSQFRRAIKAQQ